MSSPIKPREFWISDSDFTIYHLDTLIPHTFILHSKPADIEAIHVIEKSAYDELQATLDAQILAKLVGDEFMFNRCTELQAQCEKFEAVLKEMKSTWKTGVTQEYIYNLAVDTLTEYEEWKKK